MLEEVFLYRPEQLPAERCPVPFPALWRIPPQIQKNGPEKVRGGSNGLLFEEALALLEETGLQSPAWADGGRPPHWRWQRLKMPLQAEPLLPGRVRPPESQLRGLRVCGRTSARWSGR